MSPRFRIARLVAAVAAILLCAVGPTAADEKPKKKRKPAKGANMNLAEGRFAIGDFATADELATAVLEAEPESFRALHLRGQVALLDNRLEEAEDWLARAIELRPTHKDTREALAQVFYRQDRFEEAAVLLAALGDEAKAAKLATFAGQTPYAVDAETALESVVTLPFVQTDPLPVVRVSVNGSEPAAFLIDTGASEIYLDTEWAAEIGVETLGLSRGTFGGGRQADVAHGRAESVGLGELVLRNVPVQLLDTTPFSTVAPGEDIRGILGTVLFYHFLTTLDYPGGELRFEPRRAAGEEGAAEAEAAEGGEQAGRKDKGGILRSILFWKNRKDEETDDGSVRIPFWLGGDHYIVARGRANDADPTLFFVDTGLAGLAFTCPESTIEEAGVELIESAASTGVGGGGEVRVVPFMLESLTLGEAEREDLPGVLGPFPASLEHSAGFRIGGIVSHGFLRYWAVTFDFEAMEIVLREPER